MPKKLQDTTLIIVESPTKAKTLGRFLDSSYTITSSLGHIRDLPKSKMGVDIEHDFAPQYVIPRDKQKHVTALKKLAEKADHILFATDEDREGEAISWHLKEILGVPEERAERIVFHEITQSALEHALKHPRRLDMHRVDAQQARRILDRLVGYELSPFLWRKVTKGLSAGRVQSVAVRLIVERERDIQAFVPVEYWSIEALLHPPQNESEQFTAHLVKMGEETVDKHDIKNQEHAESITTALQSQAYSVSSIVKKDVKKSPLPPYTTSTLQQDAYRRLRYSPKQTMMFAQQLYEGVELKGGSEGLISYMRTDSVNLAQDFLQEAQSVIAAQCGKQYAQGTRAYKTKSKLAQEAHEAIRPTSAARTPESIKQHLNDQQWKLYDLIWRRAIASQMSDAQFEATTIDVAANGSDGKSYTFRANGQVCRFDGFLNVYKTESEEVNLPSLTQGQELICKELKPEQHFTKPPARYSEASLVKALEEYGIGRPSTYAPTISTIIERNYVQREEGRLKPTDIAFLVIDLLVEHFPSIVDYEFTARMEDDLDTVAEGRKEWVPVLREFYEPFHTTLKIKEKELEKTKISVEETDELCDKCGKPMVIRTGRFGKFMACSGFPECKNAKPLPGEESAQETADVEPCEKCGKPMVQKRGRFGPFYGCSGYPDCKNIRNARDKKLDMKCPKCGQGDVVMKRSKRGKTFFGCNKYPDCDFVSWTKPEEAIANS
ncbi:type I DNA topoisomerase [Candidatus Uhrbacteria bacterium]|nr:type I DNA topoisomerase [Candidatus Uhrbacteria bacterium]